MAAQLRTRVRPAFVHLPDRELRTTRRRRYAWRFRCETCGYEARTKDRTEAKTAERAHREWHAHQKAAMMRGLV